MTGPDRAPGRVLNGSGSIAILVTIILLSLLGAWGLFQDLRPTLAGIDLAWFAVALGSWLLYGALLLLAALPAARRFGPAAGFAVGVLVGVSFQVVEYVVFTVQAMLEGGGGSVAVLLQMGFLRGVVGLFSHVAYSGAIGAAIGWAVAAAPGARARRVVGAVVVWVLMVGLHMFSNWTTTAQAGVLYLASMGLGLLVLIVAYRRVSRQSGTVASPAG